MLALLRLLRWLLAVPLRILGHRYVRLGGLLAITVGFFVERPTDPAFYGAFGSFLLLSFLARPLGRWITPKPQRKPLVLPTAPSRPAPAPVQVVQPPAPAPQQPLLPEGPRRPLPSPVVVAVPAPLSMRSPGEGDIRARLPVQLQKLLANSAPV